MLLCQGPAFMQNKSYFINLCVRFLKTEAIAIMYYN